MSTKRIEWLDYTKGFGILLIMMAHVFQYFTPLHGINSYICSFHVPIFFIAAGYLAGTKKSTKMSAGRVKGLLIPYIVFSLINSAMKLAILFLKKSLTVEVLKKELVELTITGNGTVWFLLCLLLVELCHLGLAGLKIRDYGWLVTGLVLLKLVVVSDNRDYPFLVVMFRVIAGLAYYCIGYGMCGLCCEQKIKLWMAVLLLVAGLITEIIFGCQIDFFNGDFANLLTMLVCSVGSSIGYMYLLEKMEKTLHVEKIKRVLSYFGKNSLVVMLVHPILLQVVMYPLGSKIGQLQGIIFVLAGIMIYIEVVIFEIPFIKIITGYFPFILGRSKKTES
ncbi:MAG: acyltransferase family protein [Lachnospiraceae bacterium]|nr:acyltransferase family protein [Lachnospiraceae bacterium]